MYERFTDRARKVIQLANQAAQKLNHEYIGTEHILLGLMREGGGVAGEILSRSEITVGAIEAEIAKVVQPGPDMVLMGKLPQTPRSKRAIEYAMEESRNLNHNYVGTEHLLLGLLREREGIAALVLGNLGLTIDKASQSLRSIFDEMESQAAESVDPRDMELAVLRSANIRLRNALIAMLEVED